jgi:hypothetical protein
MTPRSWKLRQFVSAWLKKLAVVSELSASNKGHHKGVPSTSRPPNIWVPAQSAIDFWSSSFVKASGFVIFDCVAGQVSNALNNLLPLFRRHHLKGVCQPDLFLELAKSFGAAD